MLEIIHSFTLLFKGTFLYSISTFSYKTLSKSWQLPPYWYSISSNQLIHHTDLALSYQVTTTERHSRRKVEDLTCTKKFLRADFKTQQTKAMMAAPKGRQQTSFFPSGGSPNIQYTTLYWRHSKILATNTTKASQALPFHTDSRRLSQPSKHTKLKKSNWKWPLK